MGSPPSLILDKHNLHNGGVCLYYKENPPIKQRVDLQLLNETIVAEFSLKHKKIFFISYQYPNKSLDAVEYYIMNLGNIIDKAKLEKAA